MARRITDADRLEDAREMARFLAARIKESTAQPGVYEIMRCATARADREIDRLPNRLGDDDEAEGTVRSFRVKQLVASMVAKGARDARELVPDAADERLAMNLCLLRLGEKTSRGRNPEFLRAIEVVPYEDDETRPLEYRASYLAAVAREFLWGVTDRIRVPEGRDDLARSVAALRAEVRGVEAWVELSRKPGRTPEERMSAFLSARGCLERAVDHARAAEAVAGTADSLLGASDPDRVDYGRGSVAIRREVLEAMVATGTELQLIAERFGVQSGRKLLIDQELDEEYDRVIAAREEVPDAASAAAPAPTMKARIAAGYEAAKARKARPKQGA